MPSSSTSRGRPFVLGVERVNNPHILPIFDELAKRDDIEFQGVVLRTQPPWRVELGWPELPEDSPLLRVYRGPGEKKRYHQLARDADVVIWPGLKHPGGVPMILRRNLRGRLNIIWAERFAQRRARSWLNTQLNWAVVKMLNSRSMHLMTLGTGAEEDYLRFGATRWTFWQFGYAVRPIDVPETPRAEGPIRLLFAGALNPRKGVDLLLRALADPRVRPASWELTVAGAGAQETELKQLAVSLGLESRVRFTGMVPLGDMDGYYRASDVLVLPSRFDGWGAVVNEAMEYGLAVLVSDSCGCAEMLVEHGTNGFVFPSGDLSVLSECLAKLVESRERCLAMRVASRERIAMFRPAVAAEAVAALFRGLTGYATMPTRQSSWCKPLGAAGELARG